jgi:hypothetical protein
MANILEKVLENHRGLWRRTNPNGALLHKREHPGWKKKGFLCMGDFSPDMYEQYFLNYDRKIIESFPISIVHTHCAGIHMIELLLKIKSLKAIQINLDREAERAWDIHRLIETCRGIQREDKCVHLLGELSPEGLEKILKELDYRNRQKNGYSRQYPDFA